MNAELFSSHRILSAYRDCRRRKRGTMNALIFEKDQTDRLVSLTRAVRTGRYAPRRSVCFIVSHPKTREVFAADFSDRIVHHLVVRELEAHWEKIFIADSYACRKEKGTLAAVDRLARFLRSVSANGAKRTHYLQLDIRNFFMSIDKGILFSLLDRGLLAQYGMPTTRLCFEHPRREEYEKARGLLKTLLYHDPTENYVRKGEASEWGAIAPEKSLFNAPAGKGLPIGNLTSQFFANVYLNELDQFVKHTLKARYYLRYVDDFVLLHEDPAQLREWQTAIENFLRERLHLTLKEPATLKPISCGVNFLGYVQHLHHRLVRRRVVGNFDQKLEQYRIRNTAAPLNYPELQKLGAIVTSYLAHGSKANSYRIITKTLGKHCWLKDYYRIRKWKASIRPEIQNARKVDMNRQLRGGFA